MLMMMMVMMRKHARLDAINLLYMSMFGFLHYFLHFLEDRAHKEDERIRDEKKERERENAFLSSICSFSLMIK